MGTYRLNSVLFDELIVAGISASAPGKAILFGEHAVVYGQPAIAVPLPQLRSHAYITADPLGSADDIFFSAPDINLHQRYRNLPDGHPFRAIIDILKGHFGITHLPAMHIKITSSIPVASGLGSGTSVSVTMFKGISEFIGHPLSEHEISSYTFEIEKIYHGHPSGIDNTVIAYQKPIFFTREHPIELLSINFDFSMLLVDSGIRSHTADVVNDVRKNWLHSKEEFEEYFSAIGDITKKARTALSTGNLTELGALMVENHRLLKILDVSHEFIDRIVGTAVRAGAYGAKLSGAGRGGYVICLVDQNNLSKMKDKLSAAGFSKTIDCLISGATQG